MNSNVIAVLVIAACTGMAHAQNVVVDNEMLTLGTSDSVETVSVIQSGSIRLVGGSVTSKMSVYVEELIHPIPAGIVFQDATQGIIYSCTLTHGVLLLEDSFLDVYGGTHDGGQASGGEHSIKAWDQSNVRIFGGRFYGEVSSNVASNVEVHGGFFYEQLRCGNMSDLYIDGGEMHDELRGTGNSTITLQSGVVLDNVRGWGECELLIHGGTVHGKLFSSSPFVAVYGGELLGEAIAHDTGSITVHGGHIQGGIEAQDSGSVTIYGGAVDQISAIEQGKVFLRDKPDSTGALQVYAQSDGDVYIYGQQFQHDHDNNPATPPVHFVYDSNGQAVLNRLNTDVFTLSGNRIEALGISALWDSGAESAIDFSAPVDIFDLWNGTLVFQLTGEAPPDITADGQINGSDLAVLLAAWGTPSADFTGDGITDAADLAVLLSAWTG